EDVRLIGLLADARRRPGRRYTPAPCILGDDRTAVIEHAPAQIHRRVVLHQVSVDGIPAGIDTTREQYHIPHLEGPYLLFGDRRLKRHFSASARETSRRSFRREHRL